MDPVRLTWPVLEPRPISAPFGAEGPWWTTYGKHTGLDIAKDHGTPVYAAGSGTVVFSGPNGSFGECVIIDHGWGRTLYAHLSTRFVPMGSPANSGTHLGNVGDTGLATGPHLHFGVYPYDEPQDNGVGGAVDPMPWLTYEPPPPPVLPPPVSDRYECEIVAPFGTQQYVIRISNSTEG